jgi:hypothetical protein
MWPKVLPHVKKNTYIINQNHIFSTILFKFGTNKYHSYKHNEQINNQNIDNSECFGVKFVKIYQEMTSQ